MKSRRARQPLLVWALPAGSCSSTRFRQELVDISGRMEVHHRLVAFLDGEQLRDFHVSASARSPSSRFSHLSPQCLLLVFPSAAVAEEMFPRLGCPGSTATPPPFVIVSVSELFKVCAHWRVSGLQLVDSRCPRLHANHRDGSLAPSLAFQPVAMTLAAFVGLPLSLRRRLCS